MKRHSIARKPSRLRATLQLPSERFCARLMKEGIMHAANRSSVHPLTPKRAARLGKHIDQLTVEDITAEQVRHFLQDLEQTRGCSVATRNQRLAVVHALARFIAEHSPELLSGAAH